MKKMLALMLALVMVFGLLTGCGSDNGSKDAETTKAAEETKAPEADTKEAAETEAPAAEKTKLTIWTLANDLDKMSKKYMEENKNVEVEVRVIEPGQYVATTQTAIEGGDDSIDIICGEPQMLGNMFDAGLFADLGALGGEEFKDQIVDYVYDVGTDADGVLRALSYQVTPAGFYYRRDIAEKVFGTDDPDQIYDKIFSSYDKILDAAKTLKDQGYRIFASTAETNYFSGDSAWVVDGALNVDPSRVQYMDFSVELYQKDYTAYAAQWAAPWYAAMAGPVAILTADLQWGNDDLNVWDKESFNKYTEGYEQAEVFAFGLPSWGVLTMRDNCGDTAGKWGVCGGPAYGFGGGTFVGVSELSKNKEEAYKFIQWMLSDETLNWWIVDSKGDVVSKTSVLEAHKDDENAEYGGEKMYAMWLKLAEGIDYSKVTQYDTEIGNAWGAAIEAIQKGEKTKEDAIKGFYDKVESTYPDLKVERTLLN